MLQPAKLRLAATTMALVNATCALGPTPLPETLALVGRIVAVLATAAVLLLARGLRRGLPPCQRGP